MQEQNGINSEIFEELSANDMEYMDSELEGEEGSSREGVPQFQLQTEEIKTTSEPAPEAPANDASSQENFTEFMNPNPASKKETETKIQASPSENPLP